MTHKMAIPKRYRYYLPVRGKLPTALGLGPLLHTEAALGRRMTHKLDYPFGCYRGHSRNRFRGEMNALAGEGIVFDQARLLRLGSFETISILDDLFYRHHDDSLLLS